VEPWGYIDVRDVAGAIQAALTADVHGAEVCIVAAADTVMRRPSAVLMAEIFPGVPLRHPVPDRDTLLSIGYAEQVFGWRPEHSWLDAADK
jgi:nucleoside-diphosphate-sugar epimerase